LFWRLRGLRKVWRGGMGAGETVLNKYGAGHLKPAPELSGLLRYWDGLAEPPAAIATPIPAAAAAPMMIMACGLVSM
jgi:hypothetical protein